MTFQDRTEPEGLMRELDAVLGLTEALRAQSHEFSNRLHTLVGLVGLGRYDEAIAFVTEVSTARNELAEYLLGTLVDPMVVALLLAKTSVALERGVELASQLGRRLRGRAARSRRPADGARQPHRQRHRRAPSVGHAPPRVEVAFSAWGADLLVVVSDSGPGVSETDREAIFIDGWSTKGSKSGARRGLGLALVRQIVQRRGGFVEREPARWCRLLGAPPRLRARLAAGALTVGVPR